MTKYVVSSGGMSDKPEAAQWYFSELFNKLEGEINLLWCFFATEAHNMTEWHSKYQPLFSAQFPDGLHIKNSLATLEDFDEQVVAADVIYFHGGDSMIFKNNISKFNIEKLLIGKVVGLNSASTLIFSDSGWTCDRRECIQGLGVLPIKTLVHYASNYAPNDPRGPINWEAAYKELEAYGDKSLPIHALEEGEFVTFKI